MVAERHKAQTHFTSSYKYERTVFVTESQSAEYIRVADPVRLALAQGKPVVALESTVIAHGLPYPANVEVARAMEEVIAAEGATPATIALLDGQIVIGLGTDEIERLATEDNVMKASRRDLGVALASKRTAATTVAGTLACAALVSIPAFATGGIGGVHRGGARTFDISADLEELARSPVVTVCAGAKAILDLPLTLEYLETHGVPVIGYGTDELPAFYSRESGLRVPHRCDTPEEVAHIATAQWRSGLGGGLLVTCPIPEEHALPRKRIEAEVAVALAEAEEQGVRGPATTPFLLARLAQLTGGESVAANRALLLNNATQAARFARALAEL
jgi:pseudouridine-5'-phosphate glycosidase